LAELEILQGPDALEERLDVDALLDLHPCAAHGRPFLRTVTRGVAGSGTRDGVLVLEVQVALGPHRPPRHQQPGVLGPEVIR
jgi:hypothetical protein